MRWSNLLDFTVQGIERGAPFSLRARFAGAKVDALRPKRSGVGGLGRAAEDVGLPGDLEIHETGGHDRSL